MKSGPKAIGLKALGQDSVEFESGGCEELNPSSESDRRVFLEGEC